LSDHYAAWRSAVRDKRPLDVDRGIAVAGFYRHRTTGNPIAVWPDGNGGLLARVGAKGRDVDPDEGWCERVFAYAQPVDEEAYRQACADGVWPDHRLTPQHNRPPEGLSDVLLQLDDLRMEAQKIISKGEAKTQEEADTAANLVTRLQVLINLVDSDMQAAIRPLQDHLQEIERQRAPIVRQMNETKQPYEEATAAAKGTVAKLKTGYIGPFLVRVRQAARQALERTGVAPGMVNMRDGTVKVVTNAGAKGHKVSLTTRWKAEIEDYDKALSALKHHADVKKAVQQICDAAARSKAKIPIDGVKFISEEVPR
jgi:hypothetical protein